MPEQRLREHPSIFSTIGRSVRGLFRPYIYGHKRSLTKLIQETAHANIGMRNRRLLCVKGRDAGENRKKGNDYRIQI